MNKAQIYINANLIEAEINGRKCLIRSDIDMDQRDKNGRTNLELIRDRKSPINIYDQKIELHHIGQKQNGPLAELTEDEHRGIGNNKILHDTKKQSEIDRVKFNQKRIAHWKTRFNTKGND